MSTKTKKSNEIPVVSEFVQLLGLGLNGSIGRTSLANSAKMLQPLIMGLTSVSSEKETDQTGLYRMTSATEWNLPDGSAVKYGLVITFNIIDIYKLICSYTGSVYFYFYNATSKKAAWVQLGSRLDKIEI